VVAEMSTPTEEITVDLDAVPGAEVAERSQVAPDGSRTAPDAVKVEVAEAPKTEKAPKKDAPGVITPDEGVEKLKKQLEDEKSARVAAQTEAREAREAEARARNDTQSTQLDLVKGAIASVTAANDALEERYASALSTQDYAGAAKIQRELASNEAKLVDLNRGQKALESAPKAAPVRTATDKVEQFARASESQGFPRSAAWLRAHPDFVRDEAKNRRLIAAHDLALAEGYAADSNEYFASVEETLRIAPASQEIKVETDPTADAARPSTSRPSRQTAPPSAPVSRSGNGTGGSRQNVVTLTPEQVEIAKMMGQTPEEYAKELVAIRKEREKYN
jgi:hypothetical protein